MDFFKSGLKSVLGAPEPGEQPTGAETVNIPKKKIFVSIHFFGGFCMSCQPFSFPNASVIRKYHEPPQ